MVSYWICWLEIAVLMSVYAFWFTFESKQPLWIPLENDKFIVQKSYAPLHM